MNKTQLPLGTTLSLMTAVSLGLMAQTASANVLGHWTFSEPASTTGTTADSSGNGYDGTLLGFDAGFGLNGTGQVLFTGNNANRITTAMPLANSVLGPDFVVDIRFTYTGGGLNQWVPLVGSTRSTYLASQALFIGKQRTASALNVNIGGVHLGQIPDSGFLFDGNPHRLVMTYEQAIDTLKFYADGSFTPFATVIGSQANNASTITEGTLMIGATGHGFGSTSYDGKGEVWRGSIDSVRIANLVGSNMAPVAIIQEPAGFTAPANSVTNLTVGVTGDVPIYFQWYKDNIEMLGANGPTLSFSPLTELDAGAYRVVVSNLNNSVTSQVATVTVFTDTNPPTITAVQGVGPATRVVVVFSEPVYNADNPGNYSITNQTGTIGVWGAGLADDNRTVVLSTDPLQEGVEYTLVVSGIQDYAFNPLVGGVQVFTHSALVGYWPLDGDGTDLAAGNDGVIMGAPMVTQGRVGQALQFNRQAANHVQVPATPLYNLDEFTLSAWIKFPGAVPASGYLTILEHDRNGFNWYALYRAGIGSGSATRFHFRWAQFASGELQPSSTNFLNTFNADQWYHVAGTYANGTARTYLNGVLDNTISDAKPPVPFTEAPLRIGANLAGGEPFEGIIDEVRIYGRALNDTEIAALANIPDPDPLQFLPPTISGGQIILNWTGSGELQSAPAVNGPWTPVNPQPVGQSYSENIVSGENRFFRLVSAP